MALNPTLSLNDLERTKFKEGATQTSSIVLMAPVEPSPSAVLSSPSSRVMTFPASGIEQELIFPSGVTAINIMNQTSNAIFKASWQTGETSTNYFEIRPGQTYSEKNILVTSTLSLYIESSRNGTILSVIEWM